MTPASPLIVAVRTSLVLVVALTFQVAIASQIRVFDVQGDIVLVVAVAAGVLVANNAGRRAVGGTNTGGGPTADAPTTVAPASDLPEALARCPALDASEAIDCFTAYTSANPDDPDGFTQFGLFAINAGIQGDNAQLLDAGEAFLRRALEIDPADVEARVYLAVVLDRMGRAEEAAAECDRLADLDVPEGFGPLLDLACG